MSKTRESFTTPVGRLVQGSCFEAQTKDNQGNPRVYKSGLNIGQPNPQFFIAVAFPKADPHGEFAAFYAILDRVARSEWPALFPTPGGACVNPLFTFKVKDGDGIDRNGKSNASKEGFGGHWIVSFSSAYAPKVVREVPAGSNTWEVITDPAAVKRGYFVRVAGSASGNDSPNTPGIYVNLDMVALVGIGAEIVSGPDAASAFGAPAALPPGATPLGATPLGGTPALPGMPALPGAALPPPAPVVAAPPPAPSGPVMLPAANGVSYADYIAAGWTDAQLVSAGYMAAPAVSAPPPAVAPVAGYTGYMGVPGAAPGAPIPLVAAPPPAVAPSLAMAPSVAAPPVGTTTYPSSRMTAKAAGVTFEAFAALGWTEAMLVAEGYMTT